VRRFLVKQVQSFLSIGSLDDFVRRLEHRLQRSPDSRFIINEQHSLLEIRFTAVF
jgi:hypothetical protein